MAILTGKPSTAAPGVVSGPITLSPSTLISQMSITDPYWSVSSNWSYVTFTYADATGSESSSLTFPIATNTATFKVSSTARQNGWQTDFITIFDNDGGRYTIKRANFTSATEFDITVAVPPIFGSGDLRPLRTQTFSISAWIKTSVSGQHNIFTSYDGSNEKGIQFNITSGLLQMRLYGTGGEFIDAYTNATVNNGSWHHVVGVYDGSSATTGIQLYIDGSAVTTNHGGSTLTTSTSGTGDLLVGIANTGGFAPWNGNIDEFAFYQGLALSPTDVSNIYNSGVPQDLATLGTATSLVTWLRAETSLSPADSDTGTIYDRASGTHNGTTHNTSAGFLSSVVAGGSFTAKSMLFDGSNDYLLLA